MLKGQPIIIVTIQTFSHVLDEIQKNASLKKRNFAIIADEAHSSQTGTSARKLREILMAEQIDEDTEITGEDRLNQIIEARRCSENLSYYAFTATPKPRTLELFGRVPNPALPPGKENLPDAFHVYSMRQANEENKLKDAKASKDALDIFKKDLGTFCRFYKFMWPGYGENMRVLEWIVKRCNGQVDAIETQVGGSPSFADFNTVGLAGFTEETFTEVMALDNAEWQAEIAGQAEFFTSLGDHLPQELAHQRELLAARMA